MSIYEIWNEVDLYMNDKLIQPDPILDEVLKANQEAELPAIDVSPSPYRLVKESFCIC